MAALMEQYEGRLDTASRSLQQLAQQLPGIVQRSTDDQLRRLPSEVMGHVRDGLQKPVHDYQHQLQESRRIVYRGSQTLAEQLQRMERLHRQLIWKVAGITFGSLLLLLVGGSWLSKHYYDEIRENQLSAELLRAYNQADVNLCGGRLCANVESRGPKYGDKKQYRLVALRQ